MSTINTIMKIFEITQPSKIDLKDLDTKLQGEMEYTEISQLMSKTFPEFKTEIETTPDLEIGQGSVGAVYEPQTDEIIIYPTFSSKSKSIVWDNNSRTGFINRLHDVIKHELLHQTQYSKRDGLDGPEGKDKRSTEYEYMSRTDEIEAYAMNIADELVRKADKDGALALLRMANKTAQFKDEMGNLLSPDLFAYMGLWDFKSNHPVLKRLLKKVYQYITS